MSRRRQFPFPIAVFDDRFIFTTLERRDVLAHTRNPYTHPETGEIVRLFSREWAQACGHDHDSSIVSRRYIWEETYRSQTH
jgi:hypothetical protein